METMIDTDTKFAPAYRSPREAVESDFREFINDSSTAYLNYFPMPLMILNVNRQVVFFNQAFVDSVGESEDTASLGKRLGEILRCMCRDKESGGCGTSEHCSKCGALLAVLESIRTNSSISRDCQLLQDLNGEKNALDIRVQSAPFEFKGVTYYVVTLLDIADEKRREVMERVFFHDILNTAGSAQSLVRVLCTEGGHDLTEPLELLDRALYGLVEEIQTHKELRMAESGKYPVSPITVQSLEMVEMLAKEFSTHIVAEEKNIEVASGAENYPIKSDYALLRRVLINMLKNALEATPLGGAVRFGCRLIGSKLVFEVQNETVMEKSVQFQVFKRSFSTKGIGRGLGTYSIKMLTENYLNGIAEFESNEEVGTVFRVSFDPV